MNQEELLEKIGPLQPGEYILLCEAGAVSQEALSKLGCANWVAQGIHVHKLVIRGIHNVRLLRVEKAEETKL